MKNNCGKSEKKKNENVAWQIRHAVEAARRAAPRLSRLHEGETTTGRRMRMLANSVERAASVSHRWLLDEPTVSNKISSWGGRAERTERRYTME